MATVYKVLKYLHQKAEKGGGGMDPRRNEERQALRARQRAMDELVEESPEMGMYEIPEKDRLEAVRALESL